MRMNAKKQLKAKKLLWIYLGLCLIFVLLTACTSVSPDIQINASISPEPVVGEIVTLRIETLSPKFGGNSQLVVFHSEEINFLDIGSGWQVPAAGVGGDVKNLGWSGPVVAGTPLIHELTLCVTKPDNWVIYITMGTDEGVVGADQLHIISTADSAQVIPGSDYEGELQAPFGSTPTLTPEPVTISLSPECAGEGQ